MFDQTEVSKPLSGVTTFFEQSPSWANKIEHSKFLVAREKINSSNDSW